MQHWIKVLVMGTVMVTEILAGGKPDVPSVIPVPQSWDWTGTSVDLTQVNRIVLGDGYTEEDRFTAELVQSVLAEKGIQSVEITGEKAAEEYAYAIVIGDPSVSPSVASYVEPSVFDERMNEEGYVLSIDSKRVVIAGKTVKGRFYGAMSLTQLIRTEGNIIRGVIIRDYPDLKLRGVSDDMSRGEVSTPENFRRIIRFLAEHKMNVYLPYLEDIIRLEKYPSIGEGRGALSKQEIAGLQDYAARYHVEVIPVFQTLGHYENILNMDEFRQYAEYPGAASLNTQSEEALRFLESLLNEVIPLFRSEYFHIGADESWDVGRGASAPVVNRYDIATVHARHYRKVYDIVKRHGKTPIMYGDIVLRNPTILNQIPQDIIMMDWHYRATDNYPSTEVFARAGQPFLVSAGIQNWNRFYPDNTAAWLNIRNLSLEGYRAGAIGSITSNWGDYGGPNLRELNYRGFSYAGECAWNPAGADKSTIDDRFNALFFGSTDPALNAVDDLLTRLAQDHNLKIMWRYPFYPPEDDPYKILIQSWNTQRNAETISRLIGELESVVKTNREYLDYLDHVARFAGWYAATQEYAQWIWNIAREYIRPEDRSPYAETGVTRGEELKNYCNRLANEYGELWLRTNRPENLDRILLLFRYQENYLDEIVQNLRNNLWSVESEIPSKFISGVKAAEGNPVQSVYLRKRFNLGKRPRIDKAYLQVIGDSHAEVWLNGKRMGEVVATKSLSLWVENQRVKFWEVSGELNGGVNVLCAKVREYTGKRPASANLYLEIIYKDGTRERILSDPYWKSHTHPESGWTSEDYDDRYWHVVSVVDYPWKVSAPMFHRGLPSRIEF